MIADVSTNQNATFLLIWGNVCPRRTPVLGAVNLVRMEVGVGWQLYLIVIILAAALVLTEATILYLIYM